MNFFSFPALMLYHCGKRSSHKQCLDNMKKIRSLICCERDQYGRICEEASSVVKSSYRVVKYSSRCVVEGGT